MAGNVSTASSQVRVLVVDDHPVFADALSELLDRDDRLAVVGPATTAAEAVELAQATPIDVALVDYSMPVVDGATLAGQLRSLHPELGVVIVSGRSDEEILDACRAAGADAAVRKGSIGAEVADIAVEVARR